jgi:hypothetical protein
VMRNIGQIFEQDFNSRLAFNKLTNDMANFAEPRHGLVSPLFSLEMLSICKVEFVLNNKPGYDNQNKETCDFGRGLSTGRRERI